MSGYKWHYQEGKHEVQHNAVKIGYDNDGVQLVVARASHVGEMLPGKGKPSAGCTFVPYGTREFQKSGYEVLLDKTFGWHDEIDGRISEGAVPGGKTVTGETLYIGRARHGGVSVGGKIQQSHGCLYYPYGGKEHSTKHYQCLSLK